MSRQICGWLAAQAFFALPGTDFRGTNKRRLHVAQTHLERLFKLMCRPTTFRMRYLCEVLFGGNIPAFSKAAGLSERYNNQLAHANMSYGAPMFAQLVSSGLVNAEWLLCGTGPMLPAESQNAGESRLSVAPTFSSSHPVFSQYDLLAGPVETVSKPTLEDPPNSAIREFIPLARVVHEARAARKPVLLAFDADAIYAGAGTVIVEMLRRDYVTGLLLTGSAAVADFEVAVLGGKTESPWPPQAFEAMFRAAQLAASSGCGYGEALGRWAYPVNSNRGESPLAVASELQLPATVHVSIGESIAHFLPANRGAEIGAAIGAASYTDMLILTQLVRGFDGAEPEGLVLNADSTDTCCRVFENAVKIAWRDTKSHLAEFQIRRVGGSLPRRAFPALLAACNAVYDGTANDERKEVGSRKPG